MKVKSIESSFKQEGIEAGTVFCINLTNNIITKEKIDEELIENQIKEVKEEVKDNEIINKN
jgi:hypothetical protein